MKITASFIRLYCDSNKSLVDISPCKPSTLKRLVLTNDAKENNKSEFITLSKCFWSKLYAYKTAIGDPFCLSDTGMAITLLTVFNLSFLRSYSSAIKCSG